MNLFTLQEIDHDERRVSTYPQLVIQHDAKQPALQAFARAVTNIASDHGVGDLLSISAEAFGARVEKIRRARAAISNIDDLAGLTRYVRSLSTGTKDYALIQAGA